jgi:hypothetical protein
MGDTAKPKSAVPLKIWSLDYFDKYILTHKGRAEMVISPRLWNRALWAF